LITRQQHWWREEF